MLLDAGWAINRLFCSSGRMLHVRLSDISVAWGGANCCTSVWRLVRHVLVILKKLLCCCIGNCGGLCVILVLAAGSSGTAGAGKFGGLSKLTWADANAAIVSVGGGRPKTGVWMMLACSQGLMGPDTS